LDDRWLEVREWIAGRCDTFVLWQWLSATNLISAVVVDLALLCDFLALEVLVLTLDDLAERCAVVLINNIA